MDSLVHSTLFWTTLGHCIPMKYKRFHYVDFEIEASRIVLKH